MYTHAHTRIHTGTDTQIIHTYAHKTHTYMDTHSYRQTHHIQYTHTHTYTQTHTHTYRKTDRQTYTHTYRAQYGESPNDQHPGAHM